MDKSHNTHKEFAQQTCAEHTRKLLGGKSGMMFYDVTSFALRHGDTLSKVGLSKDSMTAEPQYRSACARRRLSFSILSVQR